MTIRELIKNLKCEKISGSASSAVTGVEMSTASVRRGSCFICIKGFKTDGHIFAEEAVSKGAVCVVMQDGTFFDALEKAHRRKIANGNLTLVLTHSTRTAAAVLSDAFWGHPSGELGLIGVTGTKGKTTTSLMIKNILEHAGHKSGLVGTMYNMVGADIVPTDRTTPESNVLQPLLRRMVREGCEKCVMEVSSQGLKLDRVGCCEYTLGVFTNLTPDHIGATEHPDMEDYAASKAKLFKMCEKGLFNADSPWFERIKRDATCRIFTYSVEKQADFMAKNIKYSGGGVEYDLCGACPDTHVTVSVPGKFSVYNSMAAAAACILEGVSPETAAEGLRGVVVKGKAEIVPSGRDFTVMIDYAHNPDSFINIIDAVRPFAKRVVFLFGAGGDRNRPRALMGETAATHADFTIITSDNPRTEDPAKIVADIEAGAKKTGRDYVCIVDRREAIWYAIRNAKPGDVIILAGKGHETTQIFKDRTVEFDERKVAAEALKSIYGD